MRKMFFLFCFLAICSCIYFLPMGSKLEYLVVRPQGQKIALSSLESLLQYRGETFFSFSIKRAKIRIGKAPFIKSFKLKKKFPNQLKLVYTARLPVALLGNFENKAFDENGIIFSLYPHYIPMKLPEVYFDLRESKEGIKQIEKDLLELSLQFLKKLQFEPFFLSIIDMRNIHKKHIGQKEIAVHLMEGNKMWVLRLFRDRWEEKIDLFLQNKEFLQAQIPTDAKGYLVDLRLDQLAYVSELNR